MQPFARSLIAALGERQEELITAAESVAAATPSMGPERYSRDELRQLINGFAALVREALEEQGTETYELFMGTAVPGLVADGQDTKSLVEASASFGTLVSMDLIIALPDEHREAASSWLARFFGRYVADVFRSANDAVQPR